MPRSSLKSPPRLVSWRTRPDDVGVSWCFHVQGLSARGVPGLASAPGLLLPKKTDRLARPPGNAPRPFDGRQAHAVWGARKASFGAPTHGASFSQAWA
eukprot:1171959-Alexandrium_andersonii.AAC.1